MESISVAGGAEPLIAVKEGGQLKVSENNVYKATIDAEKTAIQNSGTLTLEAGQISAKSGPAIEVGAGATLVIPEDSKAKVTTQDQDDKAILLAEKAVVKKAGTTVVVAEEQTSEDHNYVDNSGNIVLAAGAKKEGKTEAMNAAVILPDGTLVEGTATEVPTVGKDTDGKTTVTVPAGGKVQKPNGEVAELVTGGSVTHGNGTTDVAQNPEIPVSSITLNTNAQTLYVGDTAALTAMVEPANATSKTVTWSSDNDAVATVDDSGKVTAVSAGTAVITASAGSCSATCTVTVRTHSSGGGGGGSSTPASNTVSVPKADNGSVSVSPKSAAKGTAVTVTIKPDTGYELDRLTVTDKSGNTVKLTDKGNGKYTFTMPVSKVTVEASFKRIEEPSTTLPFTDVAEDFWAYDAISYAYENGLFAGTSVTTFSPDVTMTREMLWTVLGRLSGEELTGANVFEQARQWATNSGVSDGTSGSAAITREQMVTMLYRYAGSPAVSGSLSGYTDAASVSGYAVDAMAWVVGEGMLSGTSTTTLTPQGGATRAQVATILMRLIQRTEN